MNRKIAVVWAMLVLVALGAAACSLITEEPAPTELPRAEAAGLENRPWRLVSYANAQSETVTAEEEPAVVTFEDGGVGGTSGCNSFFGSYTLDGARIAIEQIGSTLMACPEPLMQQEQDLLAALSAAAGYAIEGETLQLFDAAGNVVATFAPQAEAAAEFSLTGVAWSAQAFGDGEVVSSLIAGTQITALFTEQGILSGNAGCNNYNAAYTVDGNALHIGPAASTRIRCNAPEGIMQQEQEYLSTLETVAAYRIDGATLELLDDDGALVLSFAAPEPEASACATETLANLDYDIPEMLDRTAPLRDGQYEYAPDRITVGLIPDQTTCGDITGDGSDDGVAYLWANTGGSGVFVYLAVVSADAGAPANIATLFLGDRIKLLSTAIRDAQITLEAIVQGPDDPFCCPTQQVVQVYALQDGRLVETESRIVAGLTPEKLANMPYAVEEAPNGNAWLSDGVYADPNEPDPASQTSVTLLPAHTAFGAIDGTPSAAAILAVKAGDSDERHYLALVQEQEGKPVHVAGSLLGGRIIFRSVAIEDNRVIVDMLTVGPGDFVCCPSVRVVETYALQDGELIQASGQEVSATGA